MARGDTLAQIIEMTRNECGISSNPSRGNDNREYIKQIVRRLYETICDSFDWPFLRVENEDATKVLSAGQRYYDFPVAMDMGDTLRCDHFYGNVWVPLDYGVGVMDYTAMNPELNQRADPVRKWRIKDDRQFEVWPLPASDGNKVRFTGKRLPNRLINDADPSDMDGLVIALYAAAEILAKQKSVDAKSKLEAANDRYTRLRARYGDRNVARMGMGVSDAERQRGWPRIRAFPASN